MESRAGRLWRTGGVGHVQTRSGVCTCTSGPAGNARLSALQQPRGTWLLPWLSHPGLLVLDQEWERLRHSKRWRPSWMRGSPEQFVLSWERGGSIETLEAVLWGR